MNFFKKISFFNEKISKKVSNIGKNMSESVSEGVGILRNVVYEIKNEIRVKTSDTFSMSEF